MLWIETGLVLLSVLVAFTFPRLGSHWFEKIKIEYRYAQLSRRRTLSVVFIGLLTLALRAAMLPVTCLVMFTLRASAILLQLPLRRFYAAAWYQDTIRTFGRQAIVNELRKLPQRQLSSNGFSTTPMLTMQKIVWASEMTSAEDAQLIDYYKDHQVWLLEADETATADDLRCSDTKRPNDRRWNESALINDVLTQEEFASNVLT